MAKKLSFDNLPAAVGKILEILTSGDSEQTLLPEVLQRIKRLEMQFDSLEHLLSPTRRIMDTQTVLRLLRIRRKQLAELEQAGILLSHSEGRKSYYYEDDVVRCFMNQATWKNALESARKVEAIQPFEPSHGESATEGAERTATANIHATDIVTTGRIDIITASEMLGRTKLTIYKLTNQKKIPFIKEGSRLLFDVEALKQWMNDNPGCKRKSSKNETADEMVKPRSADSGQVVDIYGASDILDRTPGAIRQHLSTINHFKQGRKLYFHIDDLHKWAETHRPYKRKKSTDENETEPTERSH